MLIVTCPICNENTMWEHVPSEFIGTADCHCGALLYINNGIAKDFHVYMHEIDSRWPLDGSNTGYVEVNIGE